MRDRDVRNAVREQLRADHLGDENTHIVEEMGVWSGSVRIDLAVINGELSGYELKSDRDTLTRLPFQAELYSKVFDRVTLVVGAKHAGKARRMIPRWWGVTVANAASGGIRLDHVRLAELNPNADPFLVAQLLWKEEAIAVLDAHGLAAGWRSKRIKEIHQRLAASLTFDQLRSEVRTALKSREGWLRQSQAGQLNVPVHADVDPAL